MQYWAHVPAIFVCEFCVDLKGKKAVKEAKKTVEAKKKDVTSADDKPTATTVKTAETSEIVEDDGEEDEGKTVRRRVRRET